MTLQKEMGLGKSLVALALIGSCLDYPTEYPDGEIKVSDSRIQSIKRSTTLIVTPKSSKLRVLSAGDLPREI